MVNQLILQVLTNLTHAQENKLMLTKADIQVFNTFYHKKTKFCCTFIVFHHEKILNWISQYILWYAHCYKYIRWLVVDIEITISDDDFQAKPWLTDITCTRPEFWGSPISFVWEDYGIGTFSRKKMM